MAQSNKLEHRDMKKFSEEKKNIILIVDDEIAILKTLKDALEDEDFFVHTLSDGSKTLSTIGDLIPDLLILDIFMPNINGLNLLEQIKTEYPNQQVIIISGYGTVSIAVDAIKKGARDFIEKPINLDDILNKINFIKQNESEIIQNNENIEDLKQFEIIGKSELFLEFINQVKKTAPLKTPSLIYGQHGTGRSLIAKYLAYHHHQNNKPFIEIDCSQKNQLESLNLSDGTIFFKNIHELGIEDQKEALRFIKKHKDYIKIIASSLPDLFVRVRNGLFNDILFYELNNIPLEIIPLNKRRYDIPLLAYHFLNKTNNLMKKNSVFHTNSLRILRNHNWSGNITQLKNIVEYSVRNLTDGNNVITPEMLESLLPEVNIPYTQEQSFTTFCSLDEATEYFEKKYLLYLLKKHHYNLEQLGESIKISLPELKAKIYKLNLLNNESRLNSQYY